MNEPKSGFGWTILSAAAFLVIAVALGGVTWWFISVMFTAQEDLSQYGARVSGRASRATAGMFLGLIGAAVGALFFGAVGTYTLWLGLTDFRKKPVKDTSWKDMPFPKG